MKYVAALVVGLLTGALLFVLGLYYNPFADQPTVSPLAVTDNPVMELNYDAVPAESLLYTDHGESNITPIPDRVNELWEPAIEDTAIFVTILEDSQGGSSESRGEVINLMSVGGVQQVMLQVKVAEISRSELRRLDVRFNTIVQRGTSPYSSGATLWKSVSTSSGPNIECVFPEPVWP